jgi:hypothetical protein
VVTPLEWARRNGKAWFALQYEAAVYAYAREHDVSHREATEAVNDELRAALERCVAHLHEVARAIFEMVAPPLEQAAATMREIGAQLAEAGVLPEADPIPDDPLERALWAKRRRSTGPALPRLDGRRR